MISSELVIGQDAASLLVASSPQLSDGFDPQSVLVGRGNEVVSAYSDSWTQGFSEVLASYESSYPERVSNVYADEAVDRIFLKRNQLITTTPVAKDEASALTRTSSENRATEQDLLTGTITGQALVNNAAANYNYFRTDVAIPSGLIVDLEWLGTSARNIVLESTNSAVPNSGFNGINGGFFERGTRNLLSIAVNDDVAVNENRKNDPVPLPPLDRRGRNNDFTARGTVYWNGADNSMGVAQASNVQELTAPSGPIDDPLNYWAQGGISMGLRDPVVRNGLPQVTIDDRLENITGGETGFTQRSGLVFDEFDTGAEVYLVITRDAVTLGEFRSAIKAAIPNADDGIFLDGGGSTQLKADGVSYPNGNRIIPQMVTIQSPASSILQVA